MNFVVNKIVLFYLNFFNFPSVLANKEITIKVTEWEQVISFQQLVAIELALLGSLMKDSKERQIKLFICKSTWVVWPEINIL